MTSTLIGVVLTVLGGVQLINSSIVHPVSVVYAQEPEQKPILIEVQIDWTADRIIKEIEETFPDAPIMLKVARCESSLIPEAHNTTLNTDGTTDGGIFQLNTVHDAELERLGFDKFDPGDNIAYARMLYDQSGLAPWKGSKHCWNK